MRSEPVLFLGQCKYRNSTVSQIKVFLRPLGSPSCPKFSIIKFTLISVIAYLINAEIMSSSRRILHYMSVYLDTLEFLGEKLNQTKLKIQYFVRSLYVVVKKRI